MAIFKGISLVNASIHLHLVQLFNSTTSQSIVKLSIIYFLFIIIIIIIQRWRKKCASEWAMCTIIVTEKEA